VRFREHVKKAEKDLTQIEFDTEGNREAESGVMALQFADLWPLGWQSQREDIRRSSHRWRGDKACCDIVIAADLPLVRILHLLGAAGPGRAPFAIDYGRRQIPGDHVAWCRCRFLWIGVMMSVKRLRDAGQPLWLVVLFFTPFINLLFFIALCFLPSRGQPETKVAAPWPEVRPLDGFIPRSQLGSALLSILLTSAIGLFFTLLGTTLLGSYGWSLFVALPFCLGLFAVLLHSYHGPRDYGTSMSVAMLPLGIIGAVLLVVAIEGLVCIFMAAPIALGLGVGLAARWDIPFRGIIGARKEELRCCRLCCWRCREFLA